MRLATLAGIAVLAASTAALAQVTGTPTEQKVPAANSASDQKTDTPTGENGTGSNGAAPSNAADIPPAADNSAPAPSPSPSSRRSPARRPR